MQKEQQLHEQQAQVVHAAPRVTQGTENAAPSAPTTADASPTPHKRRVRYAGTHPKSFREKYKEQNPEKYQDEVQKIIAKGNTPAGMHISICVQEILDFLQIQPGQKGLDATLGYGGHTSKMLEQLQGSGHVYGLDIDPIEIEKTKARLLQKGFGEDVFTAVHINFAQMDEVAAQFGPFDFLLADLGVSSMQIDDPERGFSFKRDGALDLRLNPTQGVSGAQRLATITQDELEGMLIENADEPYAHEIARAVVQHTRRGDAVDTTGKLRAIVQEVIEADRTVVKAQQKETIKKSCQRTFQALRIDVNNEYEVLYTFLEKLPTVLAPGGRAAILTFHSGEDRLVKQAFKAGKRDGTYSEVARDVIRPSAQECAQNPRASSTKMRWAIKA